MFDKEKEIDALAEWLKKSLKMFNGTLPERVRETAKQDLERISLGKTFDEWEWDEDKLNGVRK